MKVTSSNTGPFSNIKGTKTEKSGKKDKSSKVDISHDIFLDVMNEVDTQFEKKELQEGFEKLENLGKELVRNPNLKLLEEYKKRVSAFLKEALKKIYKVESKEGLPRIGQNAKLYLNIEKIDKSLEELTKKFIKNQGEAINIIKEVEGIQGLIYNVII